MSKILLIANNDKAPHPDYGNVGELIDNFPGIVARFNYYDIGNGHSGTRTDLWILRRWMFKKAYLHCLPIPEHLWRDKVLVPSEIYRDKGKQLVGSQPTLGLVSILHFLDLKYFVFLYGFDFYKRSEERDPSKVGNHNPAKEKKYLEYLESQDKRLLFWQQRNYDIPQGKP